MRTPSWYYDMDTLSPSMMTSSSGNIFRVTGPVWGESSVHRWIPLTKASDAELLYFLWSAPDTAEQAIGDLRRHNAHYDAAVMLLALCSV